MADRVAGGAARSALATVSATPQLAAAPATMGAVGAAPDAAGAGLRCAGQALPPAVLDRLEPHFGHDFSAVRVHADATAQASAQALQAQAYTVGQDIVFGAGKYQPNSASGLHLLAHELTHVVQQAGGAARVQRQPAPAPPCPRSLTLSSGRHAVHVPACGTVPVVARRQPANAPVTWSLTGGASLAGNPGVPTTVAAGTRISNSVATAGQITVDPAQSFGFIAVNGDGASGCAAGADGSTGRIVALHFAATPTAVGSTSIVGTLANADEMYGAQFANTLTSASGDPAHLHHAHINERFAGLATPNATTHAVETPFGTFTLTSNPFVLNSDAPGWDISAAGVMSPDNIGIARSFINVGRFIASASNRTPAVSFDANGMVGFSVRQDLHWLCPQAAVGAQWVMPAFTTLTHTRHLVRVGDNLSFLVGIPAPSLMAKSDPYTGHPAIFAAQATPGAVAVSAGVPRGAPRGTRAAPAHTATITAQTLPGSLTGLTGAHALRFSIRGNALGCRVSATTGVLTVGAQTGTITVRVSDAVQGNPNFDEVRVPIVAPGTAVPAPGAAPTGTTGANAAPLNAAHPGLYPQRAPGQIDAAPPLPVLP